MACKFFLSFFLFLLAFGSLATRLPSYWSLSHGPAFPLASVATWLPSDWSVAYVHFFHWLVIG